jgi:hypothetical protein
MPGGVSPTSAQMSRYRVTACCPVSTRGAPGMRPSSIATEARVKPPRSSGTRVTTPRDATATEQYVVPRSMP